MDVPYLALSLTSVSAPGNADALRKLGRSAGMSLLNFSIEEEA
jgi:hypothetical protein